MRITTLLLGLAMLLPLNAMAAAGFHAPVSDAEKRLDYILKSAEADENRIDTLPHRYSPVTDGSRMDYTQALTKRLIAAQLKHDKATVQRECTNGEHAGARCATDTNPLSCISNDGLGYAYKTLSQSSHATRIAYTWPTVTDKASDNAVIADYTLVKQAGLWKIDAIHCSRHDGDKPSSSWAPKQDNGPWNADAVN